MVRHTARQPNNNMKRILLLTLALGATRPVLLHSVPNTERSIEKIASLTLMTLATEEVATALTAWKDQALNDPSLAMLHGCNYIDEVLSQIIAQRGAILAQYSGALHLEENAQVRKQIAHCSEGTVYLLRLVDAMGRRSPSPIPRTTAMFQNYLSVSAQRETVFNTEFKRCITPPPPSSQPILITRPRAEYPQTQAPVSSPASSPE